jgi:hypothetical protein
MLLELLLLLGLLVLVLVRLLVRMLLVRVVSSNQRVLLLLLWVLASQRTIMMRGRFSLTLRAAEAVGWVQAAFP